MYIQLTVCILYHFSTTITATIYFFSEIHISIYTWPLLYGHRQSACSGPCSGTWLDGHFWQKEISVKITKTVCLKSSHLWKISIHVWPLLAKRKSPWAATQQSWKWAICVWLKHNSAILKMSHLCMAKAGFMLYFEWCSSAERGAELDEAIEPPCCKRANWAPSSPILSFMMFATAQRLAKWFCIDKCCMNMMPALRSSTSFAPVTWYLKQ